MNRLPGAFESSIVAARRGDKAAAQRVARDIAEDLAAGRVLSPVAQQYLVDGLQQIAAGVPGNVALNTSGKKGRPEKDTFTRDLMLAVCVHALVERGASQNAAVTAVAGYWNNDTLNESAIEKIYRARRAWCRQIGSDIPADLLAEIQSFLPR